MNFSYINYVIILNSFIRKETTVKLCAKLHSLAASIVGIVYR